MYNHYAKLGSAALAVILAVGTAHAGAYENPPEQLMKVVRPMCTEIAKRHSQDEEAALESVQQRVLFLITQTALDALDLRQMEEEVVSDVDKQKDKAAENAGDLGETARIDKQTGSSASSPGTTGLVEKAGIPYLLTLAVENGAIQQETRGTVLTLSSSPYALMTWGNDTAKTFHEYRNWRRLGVSASFSAENGDAATINNLDTEELSEVSARFRIIGDRSTRSQEFLERWKAEIQPDIQKYMNAKGKVTGKFLQKDSALLAKRDAIEEKLVDSVRAYYAGTVPSDKKKQAEDLQKRVLDLLHTEVYEPIRDGRILIDDETRAEIKNELFPQLAQMEEVMRRNPERLKALIDDFNRQDLLTFAYSFHPIKHGTDFSEVKLVYEKYLMPLDLAVNAGLSLNHDPGQGLPPTQDQDTIRDYAASLSLTYQLQTNPFTRALDSENMAPITISAAGEFSYVEDLNDSLGVVQVKIEVPLVAGFSLPISLSYASRTETEDKDMFTVSFGAGFDLDTMAALARLRTNTN